MGRDPRRRVFRLNNGIGVTATVWQGLVTGNNRGQFFQEEVNDRGQKVRVNKATW